MIRFGASDNQIKSMDDTQVFMVRLNLLVIIIKAALKGYPVGEFRKQAAIDNANEIHKLLDRVDISSLELSSSSHLFRQRIKLLCIMGTAIVSENYPLGKYRRQAVEENLEAVVRKAFPNRKMDLVHEILKVA